MTRKMILTPVDEEVLASYLRNQPFGTIVRTQVVGLSHLLPIEIYEGQTLGAQRKIVDELDNITIWKMRR